jgi:hypothetical protein
MRFEKLGGVSTFARSMGRRAAREEWPWKTAALRSEEVEAALRCMLRHRATIGRYSR